MNQCSGCGYMVPAAWTECRRCGAPIVAAPAAVASGRVASMNGSAIPPSPRVAAPPPLLSPPPLDDALLPGARPRDVGPDTMLPLVDPIITHAPSSVGSRWNGRTIAAAAVALVVVVAGVYSAIPRGAHAKPPPEILAPRPPSGGIPTSLSDVVRIAAESARHTALATVIDAAGTTGAPLTPEQLRAAQPSYQWVSGGEPSTTNTIVSITSGPAIDVIAVSGTDRDICAFGRWSPTLGSDYVTMAHQPNCAATNAPTTGWTSVAGGSAQDLPNVDGT